MVIIILFATLLAQSEGLNRTVRFYKDLNCLAEDGYDCSIIAKMRPDRCYGLNGKEYLKGEKADMTPCYPSCICDEQSGINKTMWKCQHLLCDLNITENCRALYERNACCPKLHQCGTALKQEKTCSYGGKQYLYGEKFTPKEHPCLICFCDENFNGNLSGPACSPVECNTYLKYQSEISKGCTPVFTRDDACCPSQRWLCGGTQTGKKGPKCNFGGKEYSIGERFLPDSKKDKCIECTCEVPPFPTCTHMKSCGRYLFWNTLYNANQNMPPNLRQ